MGWFMNSQIISNKCLSQINAVWAATKHPPIILAISVRMQSILLSIKLSDFDPIIAQKSLLIWHIIHSSNGMPNFEQSWLAHRLEIYEKTMQTAYTSQNVTVSRTLSPELRRLCGTRYTSVESVLLWKTLYCSRQACVWLVMAVHKCHRLF